MSNDNILYIRCHKITYYSLDIFRVYNFLINNDRRLKPSQHCSDDLDNICENY